MATTNLIDHLDDIRNGVRWMDSQTEGSLDQIEALQVIRNAADAALVALTDRAKGSIVAAVQEGDMQDALTVALRALGMSEVVDDVR